MEFWTFFGNLVFGMHVLIEKMRNVKSPKGTPKKPFIYNAIMCIFWKSSFGDAFLIDKIGKVKSPKGTPQNRSYIRQLCAFLFFWKHDVVRLKYFVTP